MRKIPTLFVRDEDTNRRYVKNEVHPACIWVIAGEGTATRKFDGSGCRWFDGRGWRRREIRAADPGTPLPPNGIVILPELLSDVVNVGENLPLIAVGPEGFDVSGYDEATGKVVGWVPVTDDPADAIAREAFDLGKAWGAEDFVEGQTYELVGPKINRNPDGFDHHVLIRHGFTKVADVPRGFESLREWMANTLYEGIVWHHDENPDGEAQAQGLPEGLMKKLRWYSHANVKRYGWRTLYLQSPRVYKWGLHVCVFVASTFGLGVIVFRDHEDDEWVTLVCLGFIELRITRVRYWCRREARENEDRIIANRAEKLHSEIEDFLR